MWMRLRFPTHSALFRTTFHRVCIRGWICSKHVFPGSGRVVRDAGTRTRCDRGLHEWRDARWSLRLTDDDGDGRTPISLKMHGTLDAVQEATAALGPELHGFADEPEAKHFWGQATNEVGVIATTD